MRDNTGVFAKRCRINFPVLWLLTSLIAGVAVAQDVAPMPVMPDSLHWVSPPPLTGVQVAWVLGTEKAEAPYVLRVRLDAGARIPPHRHPDERNTTVLEGIIYVGFGETFDEAHVVAVPAGAVYVAPANVPHYIWARDGEAVYQEGGVGPTATEIVEEQ